MIYRIRAHEVIPLLQDMTGSIALSNRLEDWEHLYGDEFLLNCHAFASNIEYSDRIRILDTCGDYCYMGCPFFVNSDCFQSKIAKIDICDYDRFIANKLKLKINKDYNIGYLKRKIFRILSRENSKVSMFDEYCQIKNIDNSPKAWLNNCKEMETERKLRNGL